MAKTYLTTWPICLMLFNLSDQPYYKLKFLSCFSQSFKKKKIWDYAMNHCFEISGIRSNLVRTWWRNMRCGQFEDVMCSPQPTLRKYLCAGGALASPNRPEGQQKCPQMGCLRQRKERVAVLARLTAKASEEIHHAYVINMISEAKCQPRYRKWKKSHRGVTLLNINIEISCCIMSHWWLVWE